MNIKKYIASGILEQYVLGITSDDESKEVERNAQQYSEIREEIKSIELTLERFARLQSIAVPKNLLSRIKSKINDLEK